MKKIFRYILLLVFIVVLTVVGKAIYDDSGQVTTSETPETNSDTSQPDQGGANDKFQAPVSDYLSRITKKDFGTFVEPGNSPVDPEKFRGYHSAIDLEIISGEENSEVSVTAVCDGELAIKRMAQGYGGVVAQYCEYQASPVTVIYGHLNLSSVGFNVGNIIKKGDRIGILGQPGPDTDDERKHLHLGIRKGHSSVILGYVQSQSALSDYIDPKTVLVQ